jgi:hypothetical protein
MAVQPAPSSLLSSGTFLPNMGSLLPKWCKIVGGSKSNSVMETAREGARAGLMELNVTNIWRSRKRTAAIETLVADQQGYDLPSDFYAAHSLTLMDDTDTKEICVLTPKRDLDFQKDTGAGQESGSRPTEWFIDDGHKDRKYYVSPPPNGDAVSNYRVRLRYYTRIPIVTVNGTEIDMQQELELFLEYYVKWYLLTIRAPERVSLINSMERQWRRVGSLLKAAEMDETAHDWQLKVDLI